MRDVLFRGKKLPFNLIWILLAPVLYGLGHWMEQHPEALEIYYSGSIQKRLMQVLSTATGKLPFSLAEILVAAVRGYGLAGKGN